MTRDKLKIGHGGQIARLRHSHFSSLMRAKSSEEFPFLVAPLPSHKTICCRLSATPIISLEAANHLVRALDRKRSKLNLTKQYLLLRECNCGFSVRVHCRAEFNHSRRINIADSSLVFAGGGLHPVQQGSYHLTGLAINVASER